MAEKKTAFITGAAMGMGAMKAKKLAERGWQVFAGVLPGADTSELGNNPNIIKVEQDVTSDKSVLDSAETVAKHLGDRPLDLLINNAGIANKGTGPVEGINMEEMRFLFEVNTFGPMRVCQAFLPMIRRGAGSSRIIMAPFGIEVTSIEPGAVKTHMTANAEETTKSIWKGIPDDVKAVYEPHLRETTTTKMVEQINAGNDPDYVTDGVLALLEKKTWKPRYLIGKDVKPMKVMLAVMTERGAEKAIQKAVGIPQYGKA